MASYIIFSHAPSLPLTLSTSMGFPRLHHSLRCFLLLFLVASAVAAQPATDTLAVPGLEAPVEIAPGVQVDARDPFYWAGLQLYGGCAWRD